MCYIPQLKEYYIDIMSIELSTGNTLYAASLNNKRRVYHPVVDLGILKEGFHLPFLMLTCKIVHITCLKYGNVA